MGGLVVCVGVGGIMPHHRELGGFERGAPGGPKEERMKGNGREKAQRPPLELR